MLDHMLTKEGWWHIMHGMLKICHKKVCTIREQENSSIIHGCEREIPSTHKKSPKHKKSVPSTTIMFEQYSY